MHNAASLHLTPALSFWQRLGGLLVRPRLGAGEGLLLNPCNSVHTCFMRYAIDVVYLDREGCVLKVVPALRPWRFSACPKATSCVELLAGEAHRLDIRLGQRLPLPAAGRAST